MTSDTILIGGREHRVLIHHEPGPAGRAAMRRNGIDRLALVRKPGGSVVYWAKRSRRTGLWRLGRRAAPAFVDRALARGAGLFVGSSV